MELVIREEVCDVIVEFICLITELSTVPFGKRCRILGLNSINFHELKGLETFLRRII